MKLAIFFLLLSCLTFFARAQTRPDPIQQGLHFFRSVQDGHAHNENDTTDPKEDISVAAELVAEAEQSIGIAQRYTTSELHYFAAANYGFAAQSYLQAAIVYYKNNATESVEKYCHEAAKAMDFSAEQSATAGDSVKAEQSRKLAQDLRVAYNKPTRAIAAAGQGEQRAQVASDLPGAASMLTVSLELHVVLASATFLFMFSMI